jgi:succinyl-diaminopimelate desuccinylase
MSGSPLDPVALAQRLIRCRSVTPADDGAIAVLEEALTAQGFACTRIVGSTPGMPDIQNLWARYGGGGRHFCFAGHTDVVPPGELARWRADPFAAEILDGHLIGRGAVDMKGAIAAFAAASAGFIAEYPDFGGSISLLITGDEEGPSVNGTIKVLDRLVAQGQIPDACLVGEPTNERVLGDTIKVGRRGSVNFTLTVEGIGGHTAYPQLADNAAHRAVAMLHSLTQATLDHGTEHFQPSSLQISTIDIANPATNVIPARARACFNVRFNDLWTSQSVERWLRDRFDPFGDCYTLDMQISGESFLTPPSALAALVADAAERVTGRRPALTTGGGTSDARFIHRHCPVAEFGLVGRTMHKLDEAVSLDDLSALVAIYREVLRRYFEAA